MHCLSIVFNAGSPVMWKLLYRTESDALSAFQRAGMHFAPTNSPQAIQLNDDFGQSVVIGRGVAGGVMLEDLDQSKLAHIEMSLHEAKTRAKAQKQAQTDPELRTSQMMQGMPVLSPMGNGRM